MTIELTMPALSPTMEEGTLAKWLVKTGDAVRPGDLLAEIETDKATMEFEAAEAGTLDQILVPEGADGVKVGTVIALMRAEGEAPSAIVPAPTPAPPADATTRPMADDPPVEHRGVPRSTEPAPGEVVMDVASASALARRLATLRGVNLATIPGTGAGGRILKGDVVPPRTATLAEGTVREVAGHGVAEDRGLLSSDVPHLVEPLTGMRRTIARRLGESKRTVPHIYLTVDVRLDALLNMREAMNAALAPRGVKLSVNDLMIKALALALIEVPACNVRFADDRLLRFARADISVAVSIPGGLITPIVTDAAAKSLSSIATETRDLAARARAGTLQPPEYQGGTASLSNMGMYGIRQFAAVINPPQATILAVGAAGAQPVVLDDAIATATMLSLTGSFDHRAIDGADGARLMNALRRLIEQPFEIAS